MALFCDDGTLLTYVILLGMVDAADELEVRAIAAVAASRVLVALLRDQRDAADKLIRQIYFRASFHPKTLKFYSLSDFPGPPLPPKAFPSKAVGISRLHCAPPIARLP